MRSDGKPLGNRGLVEGPVGLGRHACVGDAAFIGDTQIGLLRLEFGYGGDDLLRHAAQGERRSGEDGKEGLIEFHIFLALTG